MARDPRKSRSAPAPPPTSDLGVEGLLSALERSMATACGAEGNVRDDAALLTEELRNLYAVRALYLAWLRERATGAEGASVQAEPPSRLLRAWAEITARVIQLLHARRALAAGAEGSLEGLMQGVLDKVDALLATGEEHEPQRHRPQSPAGHREEDKKEEYYTYSLF
jgi:hypothetical protein